MTGFFFYAFTVCSLVTQTIDEKLTVMRDRAKVSKCLIFREVGNQEAICAAGGYSVMITLECLKQ